MQSKASLSTSSLVLGLPLPYSYLLSYAEFAFYQAIGVCAILQNKEKQKLLGPPARERGLRKTGYTIAGYPYAFFGVPTIIHAKRVELSGEVWKEKEQDCGGLMQVEKVWVNDLPAGYEIVLGLQCKDCDYTDSIRFPYSGHKQLFNSASNRTWALRSH